MCQIINQREFQPVTVVSYDETNKGRVGIWMRDEVKEMMCMTLQRSLADGQLVFAKEFITLKTAGQKDIQAAFKDQLAKFREELLLPNDTTTGITKKKFTGKSASGNKDDVLICVQIALYFSGKKRLETAFRELANEAGWRY